MALQPRRRNIYNNNIPNKREVRKKGGKKKKTEHIFI
jgi:hypothetical protein